MNTAKFPPIFVISLPSATQRKKIIESHLKKHGLQYEIFSAIDGRNTDPNTSTLYAGLWRRLFFGKDLTGGEWGCLLSHRAVLQHIVDQDIDAAIILEDDVTLNDRFSECVEMLMQHQDKWSLIRLFDPKKKKLLTAPKTEILPLNAPYKTYRLQNSYGGAFAYLITKNAAEKLLKAMRKNYMPVDMIMGQPWITGIEITTVLPCIVIHDDEQDSSIGDERFKNTKTLNGWENIAHPITRAGYKLYENVMKCLHYNFRKHV